jgi:hypothetical protein
MNAGQIQRFAEEDYHLSQWAGIQKDSARKKPEITTGEIFKSLVYQPVIGKRSLLELDQFNRTTVALTLVGSERRMVASDTTILRVLNAWDMSTLRRTLYGHHQGLGAKGHAKTVLSSGRETRLLIVDGSELGGVWFSVLSFAGAVYHGVDCEPSEGRGHELATSRRLIQRAYDTLGEGFASHILYDGLMAERIDLAKAREDWKTHLVVKTQDETREIIASTKEVWEKLTKRELERVGVEMVSGTDRQHNVRYEVYAQGGIRWEKLAYPLKLAWVQENHLKGKYKGQTLRFWVITTDESLKADELREMAHNRWAIENNGFKELNEQVGSKRSYIKNARVKEALLLIWFLGMSLLKAFLLKLAQLDAWRKWGVRKTKALIAQVIILGEAGVRDASP